MTALFAALAVLPYAFGIVRADGTVVLSLSTQTQTVNPGDTITINVTCDEFDSITTFGPVLITYDDTQFDFVSVTPADVLSGYNFTIDSEEPGSITVSSAFVEIIDEETGNTIAPFSADVETTLFQVSLRATADADGDTTVNIASTGTFKKADGSILSSYSSGALTVSIAHGVSTDATLASLSIEGITMTPAFDPQVFEYSATVSRDVTSIVVNAVPNNLQATVSIDGADELSSGENIVSIHVLAQDGIRWKDYRIFVNRQENYIPEGSGFVDTFGVTYTFMTFPANLSIPEGFTQTTRTINGYSVPVFAKDGVVSVLVYVYNGTDNPALYFYNPVSGIAEAYTPESTVVTVGSVLTAIELPDSVTLPRGFSESTAEIGGVQMQGYVNRDGNFICYMRNDMGDDSFYYYDPDTGTFYLYKSVEQTAERVYQNMFYLFLMLSVLQSIFIVIMTYAIRKVVNNRTNPRPKRV